MNISFLVPAYNESNYIENIIRKIFNVSSPEFIVELLILDGGSYDGTDLIVKSAAKELNSKYFIVKLINNPLKLQASALNIGLSKSSNEFCVRLDAHLELGSVDQIRASLISSYDLLISNKVCSVGYKQRFIITSNLVQNSLYLLSLSPFLSGLRSYRLAISNKFSRTSVWLFSLLRYKAIYSGGFIVEETPNEDMGFNERLCKSTLLPLYLDINLPLYYYSRSCLISLFHQYFRYSYSRSKRRLKDGNYINTLFALIRPFVFLFSFIFIFFSFFNPILLSLFYFVLFLFVFLQIKLDSFNYFHQINLSFYKILLLMLAFIFSPLTLLVVLSASFIGSFKSLL